MLPFTRVASGKSEENIYWTLLTIGEKDNRYIKYSRKNLFSLFYQWDRVNRDLEMITQSDILLFMYFLISVNKFIASHRIKIIVS